ncbi:YlaF family protein [Bacillus sp. FJAT-49736]|uniref:YlaF family protein n=1 Tax=Bacillus sp. FJAT-49736 TaxID=2833582 RepID=UPI001BC8D033|nr:YlaF family protein [Bacillus sp. FJAT-49736]
MKNVKWIFLIYAIIAAFSMAGIGVAIGEQSILGFLICIVILIFILGIGFKTKKKWREEGKL